METKIAWNETCLSLLSMSDFPEENNFSRIHTIGWNGRHLIIQPMRASFSRSMSTCAGGRGRREKEMSFSCYHLWNSASAINNTKLGFRCVRTGGWNLIEAWMCSWVKCCRYKKFDQKLWWWKQVVHMAVVKLEGLSTLRRLSRGLPLSSGRSVG